MTIVAETYTYVVGVDTHAKNHHYAICTPTGVAVDNQQFPTTAAGIRRAVAWIARRTSDADPGGVLLSVEGTGSYGHTLTEFLLSRGYRVVEAPTPTRGPGHAKTDAVDAHSAARTVLAHSIDALRDARTGDVGQLLQILVTARDHMTRTSTATKNALTALARRYDLGINARKPLTDAQITQIAAWRTRRSDSPVTAAARAEATRLATTICDLAADLTANNKALTEAVKEHAPAFLEEVGVGPVSSAAFIAGYSYHGRIHTEAQMASLAGVAPIPASSGNTHRHRLSRGGDRRINRALYQIVLTRMRYDDTTKAYVARKLAEGRTKKEIIRQLKRYVCRQLFRLLNTQLTPA